MVLPVSAAGHMQGVEVNPRMKRGQSILEYSLLVAIVASALTLMYVYVQRSIQANLKAIEREINAEVNTQGPGPN